MKPALAAAAGKFLHVPQHLGPTPYAVQQSAVSYAELPEESFADDGYWRLTVREGGAPDWGTHVFKVGADGALVLHATNWDSSD